MRLSCILISVLLTFKITAEAQEQPDTNYILNAKQFLISIRGTLKHFPDKILLVDRPDMRMYNYTRSLVGDTSNFTKEEQELIKVQITNPLLKQWTAALVNNAEIISQDTVSAIC